MAGGLSLSCTLAGGAERIRLLICQSVNIAQSIVRLNVGVNEESPIIVEIKPNAKVASWLPKQKL